MNLLLEILKLIIELVLIVLIAKKLLVPILRKLAKSLNLNSQAIGNISGVATSIPEFLTVTFSTISGMLDAGIFNILTSNVINSIQYIISIIVNKNIKLLNNKAIKQNLILVFITIIIPIFVWKMNIENNILLVPIFIVLFYIFSKINKLHHSKSNFKNNSFKLQNLKQKKIYNYIIYIFVIGIILYLVGKLLSNTLENLCYIFNISEVIIGIILGIATSIPEFITFIESQRFHKSSNKELGLIEASNNLLVSNMLNLFIIQSISIIIINLT